MSTEEGTTTPAPAADDSGAAARIRQLVARVKELEAKVAEVEPLAAQADKWRSQYEEAKASSKAEREALRLEREIMSAGVMDAEGLDYVQHAYSKLPAEGRPPIGEWLANRDGLPKAVRAYLSDAAPAPQQAPTLPSQTAPATVPMPRTSTATVPQAPAEPAVWSAEAISRLSPSEFKAHRDAIMASLRTA
jgi:hypothetical protein